MTDLDWTWHAWPQLDPDTLYAFLKLRSDIFVVEQNCVFPEMDGLDPRCTHLCGRDAAGRLLVYLRLVPPGLERRTHQVEGERPALPDGPALGRLVVAAEARGRGLARAAVAEGLRACGLRFHGQPVRLSAQQHLEPFYASMGFERRGEAYLEDGIWHVDMLKPEGR